MSLGTAVGTDIPIEHLDYGYIGSCNSSREIEQILKVLRSGKEGHYPHLVTFTEKRLTELNPNSKLLIKSEKAKCVSDLSNEDSNDIANELKQWEEEMGSTDSKFKDKEKEVHFKQEDQEGLPPVRRPGNISGVPATNADTEAKSTKSTLRSQRIKSADYRSWDKYDVEREVEKLESEEKPEESSKPASGSSGRTIMDSELTEKEKSMSVVEKQRSATREREKGNEAFRSGDYHEALVYYTRSIKFYSTPAAHNNRAIAEIKLEKYSEAIADCSQVLSVEPHNTKALLRRATAYISIKEYREAAGDYEQLLKLDPNNKKAQEQLNLLRKDILDRDTKQAEGKKKGRKVQIQEVEDEGDTGSENTAIATGSVSNGPSSVGVASESEAPPPLPPHIQRLKDDGNDLFRRGQYGEAVNKYTKAIKQVEKDESQVVSLSTLLNNRAACHLKNGNSRGCVDDCTRSLALVSINLKALIRRGQAYEAMEKYKHAYNDYQLALRVDHSVESAYTASSRIAKMLREQEGNDWRSKLPECPEATSVMAALSRERQAFLVDSAPDDQDSDKNTGSTTTATTDTSTIPGGDDSSSTKKPTDSNRIETDGIVSDQTNPTPSNVASDDPSDSTIDRPNPSDADESEAAVDRVGGESGNESDDEGSVGDDGKDDGDGNGRSSSTSGESESETISEPVQKVPDIKPVDVTTTSTAMKDCSPHVTQSTRPVSTPFMTSESPPEKRKEMPPEEKFEVYKTKGNEHVKSKEYVDALRYYSQCIEVCPDRVAGYTNRALCHLKLGSPRNAEEDCNKALSFEPENIKALYRRGLARKDLMRYSDSAKDLKMLLNLDPSNSLASQKLAEVKQLWERELREIQAKAASANRKPRHHSSSSTAKKDKGKDKDSKDKQKKLPNMAQAEKSLRETRVALENLLEQMKSKTNTAEASTTAASGESEAKTGGGMVGGSESSTKHKKKSTTRSQTGSSKSKNNERTTPERSKSKTSDRNTSHAAAAAADMKATKTTYYEQKKDDKSSSTKDSSTGGVKKETKRKKIVIEEVDNSSESEEEVVSPAAPTASGASMEKSTTVETPSTSSSHSKVTGENLAPYEFVQRWNSIPRTAQSIEYASLLEQIPPEKLPEVITNKLDGMMLTNIIRAIDKQFVPRKLYSLSTEILQNLCKVPRFGMNAMFLGPKEKLDLKNVFRALSEQEETPIPPSTLDGLKKEYGVKS